MPISEEMRRDLSSAHQEARQVGDSPVRADRLAARLATLSKRLDTEDVSEELQARIRAALADAERVLRRDDDGHEAARHLHSALRLSEDRPRRPSPFD